MLSVAEIILVFKIASVEDGDVILPRVKVHHILADKFVMVRKIHLPSSLRQWILLDL